MKKQLKTMALSSMALKTMPLKTMAVILGLVVFAGASAAQAQIIGRIKSDIPFGFYVRDKLMPAGSYAITEMNPGSGMMEIRSDDGKSAAIFLTIGEQEKDTRTPSELIFHKYGDKVFLSEIVEQGEIDAAQVLKTKMEKRLEKAATRNEEVAIGLRLE
jgi:hypothetical protein